MISFLKFHIKMKRKRMKQNKQQLRNLGFASSCHGIVTENNSTMVIDHNKVKRAQTKIIVMVTES